MMLSAILLRLIAQGLATSESRCITERVHERSSRTDLSAHERDCSAGPLGRLFARFACSGVVSNERFHGRLSVQRQLVLR